SFKNVITFNLDEYYPMEPTELQSYVRFMNEYLFNHIDIDRKNIHIPDGTVPRHEVTEYCQRYELAIENAGGIDIQILGIGGNGHIAFNEPGSRRKSVTRLVNLSNKTRLAAASDFFGEEYVPTRAITMGVDTVMKAKRIFLLAWGDGKAGIIKQVVEGSVTDEAPATFLQEHKNVEFIVDQAAA
ncbi:6-phosphogluconolactonase, partial [Arthrospira platensis SPKY1]|nr:6-phosphogluconolactonase [Arthrospira platensis SPKY1]